MALDADDFTYVRKLLHELSGVTLDGNKKYLVETRLTPVAYQEGCASLQDFITRLRLHAPGALHMKVVEALATKETQFFRDVHPFVALKTSILPELIEKRSAERRLNLWCAAIASGQEPYSVAMLLLEHFPHLANWNVHFVASDISASALEQAQQGYYSQLEVNRGLSTPLLLKYFRRQGTRWQISEQVRRRVQFCKINLIHAWPSLPPMDVILMRNVLIYFNVETKKAILGKVCQLLRPDGYLFLGSAETTLNLHASFKKVQFDKAVCYQARL